MLVSRFWLIACLALAACGTQQQLSPERVATLRAELAQHSHLFIARLAPGAGMQAAGLSLFVDSRQVGRRVVSRPGAADRIPESAGGPLVSEGGAFVVWGVSPEGARVAVLSYVDLAATDKVMLAASMSDGYDGVAPAPVDGLATAGGRLDAGVFWGLAADADRPGVYYLGDVSVAGRIEPTRAGTIQVEVQRGVERARAFAARLGASRFVDLSESWGPRPTGEIGGLLARRPGDPALMLRRRAERRRSTPTRIASNDLD